MSDFEDGFRELPGGELEVELRGRRFVLTPEHPAMGPRHPEWQRFREATDGVTPILNETTTTIREANKQLARVDTITGNVADISGNASALVALFAASVGGPLIKLAGFSAAVRAGIAGLRGAERAAKSGKSRKK